MNNLVVSNNASVGGAGELRRPAESVQKSHRYLRFKIGKTLVAALDMAEVCEVLAVKPSQVTPMFNMPDHVMGLLTRRSRVVWLIDLARLLLGDSMTLLSANGAWPKTYSVVLTRVTPPWLTELSGEPHQNVSDKGIDERALFGLAVHHVDGSVAIESGVIQQPQGHFSASFAPCLSGTALQGGTLFHVLNADAIARLSHRAARS